MLLGLYILSIYIRYTLEFVLKSRIMIVFQLFEMLMFFIYKISHMEKGDVTYFLKLSFAD